jgi:hypothetical protein
MPTLQQRASFDEVFAFYRDSGFLYPAQLAALAPRMPALERTGSGWSPTTPRSSACSSIARPTASC